MMATTAAPTTTMAAGAPPKPWEKRGAGTPTARGGGSLQTTATAAPTMTTSASAVPASRAMPSSAGAIAASDTGAIQSPMVPSSSMYGPATGSAYGSGYGGYGGAYGGAGYGSTAYSGAGYGSGYGSGYGGGYGGTGYGYGGGYGFGGSGGYSRFGYGGMGGGMGGMMDPNGHMGWLTSFNQMVGSIGQITEMLGMNAEALHFCIGSFVHFTERIGGMFAGLAAMLSPRQAFPPGHPRHGEPGPTEEEERRRQRRVRIFQFLLSVAAVAVLYRGAKWLAGLRRQRHRGLLTAAPASAAVPAVAAALAPRQRDLESIFRQTVGTRSTSPAGLLK